MDIVKSDCTNCICNRVCGKKDMLEALSSDIGRLIPEDRQLDLTRMLPEYGFMLALECVDYLGSENLR